LALFCKTALVARQMGFWLCFDKKLFHTQFVSHWADYDDGLMAAKDAIWGICVHIEPFF
jgi:hypothetical protein